MVAAVLLRVGVAKKGHAQLVPVRLVKSGDAWCFDESPPLISRSVCADRRLVVLARAPHVDTAWRPSTNEADDELDVLPVSLGGVVLHTPVVLASLDGDDLSVEEARRRLRPDLPPLEEAAPRRPAKTLVATARSPQRTPTRSGRRNKPHQTASADEGGE